MEFVDTHCHIQSAGLIAGERTTSEIWSKSPQLTGDMLVQNALKSGVTKMICVGCDLPDSRLAVDFVQSQPNCWASVGIHPHEAKLYAGQTEKLNEFSALISSPKVVAVGECGLDFYYNHSPKADQIEILKFQIELALKNNLPMIFHVREAFNDFWPVFESYKNVRGVLHSFTDSAENLQRALSHDLFIGVNGIATFTKDSKQLNMYKSIPLKKLMLETDAPFLTPSPYRGNINEPKLVRVVANFLSGLRNENVGSLSAATSQNAAKLFNLTV